MLHHTSLVVEPPLPVLGRCEPSHAADAYAPDAMECALLALADPCLDSRISLIGPNTLELLCALLRRGNAQVSTTRVSEWPQSGTADVAIIPHVTAPDALGRAVAQAHRILTPLGTVALHLAADPAGALVQQARHLLLLHDFGAIRVLDFAGDALLRAELPLHGRLACV